MKTSYTRICIFSVNPDTLQLVKKTIELPPYKREGEFDALINSLKRDLTAKDLCDAGFEELVDQDEIVVSGVSYGRMDDNAQCYLYQPNFLLIDDHVAHLRAKEIINDERYKDAFEFCVDDEKGTFSKHKEDNILKGLERYKALCEKIGEHLNGADYGIEKFDDHALKEGILRSYIYIYDRPFIQITMNLSNKAQIRYSPTPYYDARYVINMLPFGCDTFNYLGDNGKYQHTDYNREDWAKMLDVVFELPADYEERKEKIKKVVKKHFNKDVGTDDIAYDRMNHCYYLRNEVSEELLKPFIPEVSKAQYVGKYTTTNTLFEILRNGKIRLNSIISMNDKTETSFLSDLVKNHYDSLETAEVETIRANSTHIISFSTKTDNLDMWRWYGDDGKGVCLVFERSVEKDEELKSVSYVDSKLQRRIDKIRKFLGDMKQEGIDFRFHLLEDYRHYIKPSEYIPEDECRMIVRCGRHDGWFIHSENGIMTPYIEARLVNMVNCETEGVFPYRLKRVILGPKFSECAINKTQINMLCMERRWFDVEVVESEIKSYR